MDEISLLIESAKTLSSWTMWILGISLGAAGAGLFFENDLLSASNSKVDSSVRAEAKFILFFGFFTLSLGVLVLFFLPVAMIGLNDSSNSDQMFGTRLLAFRPFQIGPELSYIYTAFIACSGITSLSALCTVWKHYFGRNFFDFFVRRSELKNIKMIKKENSNLRENMQILLDQLIYIFHKHPLNDTDKDFTKYVSILIAARNEGKIPSINSKNGQFMDNLQKIIEYNAELPSMNSTPTAINVESESQISSESTVKFVHESDEACGLFSTIKKRIWPF